MVMGSFRGAMSSRASVLGAGGSGILLLGGWDKMIGESVFVGAWGWSVSVGASVGV